MGERSFGAISRLTIKGKRLGIALAAFLFLGAPVLLTPGTSLASAYGCAGGNPWYGPQSYCVYLQGNGNYVNYVSGSFRGSAPVCNFYMTAEFFDNSWRWYQTLRNGTSWGCATGADMSVGVYANKASGYMCSTLHYQTPYNGSRTMSVCHRIG